MHKIEIEFAKSRAFRAHLPYVASCLKLLRARIFHIPTCLRVYLPIYNFRAYVPSYLKFGPTCAHFSRTYVPTTTQDL